MQNVQHRPPALSGSPVAPPDGPRPGIDVAGIDRQLTALDDADLSTHAAMFGSIHDALTRALAATTPEPTGPPGRPQGP